MKNSKNPQYNPVPRAAIRSKITSGLAFVLLVLSTFLVIYLFTSCTQEETREKHRMVILTDMTHDDGNSLIRFLYYAPWFDLEAIIVTNQLPDFNYNDEGPWNKAMGILDAYKQELPQLRKHDPGFPDYEDLVSITKRGRGALPIIWLTNALNFSGQIGDRQVTSSWDSIYYHDWIGDGPTPNGESKDSEGSEFLQEVFDKDDDRPIYVQAWGGPITLVQALNRYRERKGEEKYQKLLSKLHVYAILYQDITFDYIVDLKKTMDLNCVGLGTATSTYEGERSAVGWLLHDPGHFWRYCCSSDPGFVKVILPEEVNGHGPMSNIYDNGGEGDTPAFLYLLSSVLGLNDATDPTQGSWGNMFSPMGDGFPEGYYHTCFRSRDELDRWIPDAKKSFQNRLLWSVKDPGEVNREPVPVINGDKSNRVLHLKGKPGQKIKLDASNSFDPDGDDMRIHWFRYNEADSYEGHLEITNPEDEVQWITLPDDIGDSNIHVVLELRDTGSPDLVAYRRMILSAN
jgi:hypothetical protein